MSEYGVDLRVAVNAAFAWDDVPVSDGTWTPRRLWALVQGLPPSAAVWRDEPASWSVEREMLALLVEMTSQGQVTVPRPGQGVRAGGNVVSIDEFVRKHRKYGRG